MSICGVWQKTAQLSDRKTESAAQSVEHLCDCAGMNDLVVPAQEAAAQYSAGVPERGLVDPKLPRSSKICQDF